MTEEDLRTRIRDSYRFCQFLISTEVLEGVAILVTLLVHAGLSQVLDALPLSGAQKVVAAVFKVILFAAPFFAIVVHVIRDFRRILLALDHEEVQTCGLRDPDKRPTRSVMPRFRIGLRQPAGDGRPTVPQLSRLRSQSTSSASRRLGHQRRK